MKIDYVHDYPIGTMVLWPSTLTMVILLSVNKTNNTCRFLRISPYDKKNFVLEESFCFGVDVIDLWRGETFVVP